VLRKNGAPKEKDSSSDIDGGSTHGRCLVYYKIRKRLHTRQSENTNQVKQCKSYPNAYLNRDHILVIMESLLLYKKMKKIEQEPRWTKIYW
jgi:hypothetical protein